MGLRPSCSTTRQGRRRTAAVLALVGIVLVTAAGGMALAGRSQASYLERHPQTERVLPVPDARAVAAAWRTSAAPAKPKPSKPRKSRRAVAKQMPVPVRLIVPAIGVSAPLIPLGLNRDRTAEVPKSFSQAGWFKPGPEPGERGSAVILGHVDSRSGPGVFYHLRALRRGDRVKVVLANGESLRFVVTGGKQVSKNRFPTDLVYARTPGPTLRLITCGGRFNSATRHYVDNYLVFARLAGNS